MAAAAGSNLNIAAGRRDSNAAAGADLDIAADVRTGRLSIRRLAAAREPLWPGRPPSRWVPGRAFRGPLSPHRGWTYRSIATSVEGYRPPRWSLPDSFRRRLGQWSNGFFAGREQFPVRLLPGCEDVAVEILDPLMTSSARRRLCRIGRLRTARRPGLPLGRAKQSPKPPIRAMLESTIVSGRGGKLTCAVLLERKMDWAAGRVRNAEFRAEAI